MNLVDIITLTIICWQAVWGYHHGVKPTMFRVIGMITSIMLARLLHRPLALVITPIAKDIPMFKFDSDILMDVSYLIDFGLEAKTVEHWFVTDPETEIKSVEVLVNGMESTSININLGELLLFFLMNLLCFMIFFIIFKSFSITIIDIVKQRDYFYNVTLTYKTCWFGILFGVINGLLISALLLFIFTIVSPLGVPWIILDEINSSKLGLLMIEILSGMWF